MYGWENCDLIGETCILTKGKPLFWKDGELPQAPKGDVKKICITPKFIWGLCILNSFGVI